MRTVEYSVSAVRVTESGTEELLRFDAGTTDEAQEVRDLKAAYLAAFGHRSDVRVDVDLQTFPS